MLWQTRYSFIKGAFLALTSCFSSGSGCRWWALQLLVARPIAPPLEVNCTSRFRLGEKEGYGGK